MSRKSHNHCCEHHSQDQAKESLVEVNYTLTEPHWDSLLIKDMDCPTEERLIRDKFQALSTIEQLEFNLIKRVLRVRHSYSNIEPIVQLIAELGMEAKLYDNTNLVLEKVSKNSIVMLIIAGIMAFIAETLHYLAMPSWLVAIISLTTISMVGIPVYYKGFIALKNKTLNINALMSIAVTGAVLIGQWPEAAMVIVLFTLAEYIETLSLQKARNAIGDLLQLTPSLAEVEQTDGSWQEIAADLVPLNSIVRVKPGQRIALDGEVVAGQTTIDQSAITGESMPIEKDIGDTVFAGTVNGSHAFSFKVTRIANDTTLARIIHRVEEAQGSKAPTQRFIDLSLIHI